MTLYRQITLSIILLLLAAFLGTVIISTQNLRTFLLTQLETHAQDTATSLGLSLSTPMQAHDMTTITSMVNAVFDRGYYRQLDITTLNGDTLLSRSSQTKNSKVPKWFTDIIDLQPPVAEALVMSGWQQAGKVQVTSHPGYAYGELWLNTVDTFRWFLVLASVITVIGLIAVNILLRPLRLIESQADAICNATYPLQKKLPRTRELQRVVMAMNRMSGKISSIFAEQSALTERLRKQAYEDPVTGLGNRRYFDRQLQTLLESREDSSLGALLLLELHGLSEFNLSAGYQEGDRLLQCTARLISNRIKNIDNCFSARVSGASYGIVAVGMHKAGAESLADELCHDLLQLRADGLARTENIGHVGVALWKHQDAVHDLLAEADTALRAAQSSGNNNWKRFIPSSALHESQPWQRALVQRFCSRRLTREASCYSPSLSPLSVTTLSHCHIKNYCCAYRIRTASSSRRVSSCPWPSALDWLLILTNLPSASCSSTCRRKMINSLSTQSTFHPALYITRSSYNGSAVACKTHLRARGDYL